MLVSQCVSAECNLRHRAFQVEAMAMEDCSFRKVEGMSAEQHSLWLVAGDCEFDIKPGQNPPKMKHLLAN